MSHLTSTGTRRPAAAAAGRLGVGMPGVAHPLVAPTEWAELSRPDAPLHWAVLNVARGPGSRADPHCLAAARRLRAAGVRVLGHLDTRRGIRPLDELISDGQRFVDWYGVDGFWLARCPTERCWLPDIRRTTATLRALLDDAYLVFDHGEQPYAGYAEVADQLVTFRGPWAVYRWSQVAPWTAEHPPERFCHLVHSVPRTHLEEALRIARWQGASTVYFTDRTDARGPAEPWETLPGYWNELVSRIGTGAME